MTRGGRRIMGGRRNGSVPRRMLAQQFASLFAGQADAVYLEADNYNSGAGTWTDKIDATHVMAATGTIAAPAVTARFAGANIALTGTQYLTSNRASSRFKKLFDGTGCSVLAAYAPTSVAANGCLWSTYVSGAQGAYTYGVLTGSSTIQAHADNASGLGIFDSGSVGAVSAGVKSLYEYHFATANTPDVDVRQNGTSVFSGNATTPAAVAGSQTLVIGNLSGLGAFLSAELRAFYFLPYALSASQQVAARAWMAAL